jgi:hypothetical protein
VPYGAGLYSAWSLRGTEEPEPQLLPPLPARPDPTSQHPGSFSAHASPSVRSVVLAGLRGRVARFSTWAAPTGAIHRLRHQQHAQRLPTGLVRRFAWYLSARTRPTSTSTAALPPMGGLNSLNDGFRGSTAMTTTRFRPAMELVRQLRPPRRVDMTRPEPRSLATSLVAQPLAQATARPTSTWRSDIRRAACVDLADRARRYPTSATT